MSLGDGGVNKRKLTSPQLRNRSIKIEIPRRAPSTVIPERKIVYVTADKTTCAECSCFPKEEPYQKQKKLNPCQSSPKTLYELAARVVDSMKYPEAFVWSVEDVANWICAIDLPEYNECIRDNHINGMRLLMLEDPSVLPQINIRNFEHIKIICVKVRNLFGTDFLRFARSIGLPPRKPMTHCTWFKSRTGPNWGIRKNWTRSDVLRWMKILVPEPFEMNHWDLVWYQKPDFPKTMFARIPKKITEVFIPHYKAHEDICKEYLVPRKFRLQPDIPEDAQMIWMEQRLETPVEKLLEEKKRKKPKMTTMMGSRLLSKKISLTGLKGDQLILARRKMPKPKFLV